MGVASTPPDGRRRVETGLLVLGALAAAAAAALPAHRDYPGSRHGIFENPNLLGAVAAVVAVVAAARARRAAGRSRRVALGAAVAAVVALALSRARAAAAGLAVGFLVAVLPVAAPAAAGAAAVAAVVAPYLAVGLEIPVERLEVWTPAAALAAARPLEGWGVGRGVFEAASAASTPRNAPLWGHAHDLPLHLSVETGFVGLALALWALVAALRGGVRHRQNECADAGRAALCVLVVHAAADFVLWSPSAAGPIAAAVALAAPPPAAAATSPARRRLLASAVAAAAVPALLLGTAIAARGTWWPAATPLLERAARDAARGDVGAARASLDRAAARAPLLSLPRERLGALEAASGRPAAAHAALRAAYRRHPRPDIAAEIAEARAAAGVGAEGWPRLALERHPLLGPP